MKRNFPKIINKEINIELICEKYNMDVRQYNKWVGWVVYQPSSLHFGLCLSKMVTMVEGGATWGLGGFNFIDTKLDSTTQLLTTTDTENNTSSQYIQTTTEMGGQLQVGGTLWTLCYIQSSLGSEQKGGVLV